jgi:1-phosphofructokinase
MIITVTCNPSIDYIVSVKDFSVGALNRTTDERILPGGKGINVSIVLQNLGVNTLAYGFCAGHTGELLCSLLTEMHVPADFIRLDEGFTRINVKLRSGKETEINGCGPNVSPRAFDLLLERLQTATPKDIVVLSGSLARNMPETTYRDIMRALNRKGVKMVVDASGNTLRDVLEEHPFLIKPNKAELSGIMGKPLGTLDDIVSSAKEVHQMGAENVLVSLGPDGAVLVDADNTVRYANAPDGVVVNTIGAGDSMVAGFLAEMLATGNPEKALKLGLCAGSASACSEFMATKQQILALLPKVKAKIF